MIYFCKFVYQDKYLKIESDNSKYAAEKFAKLSQVKEYKGQDSDSWTGEEAVEVVDENNNIEIYEIEYQRVPTYTAYKEEKNNDTT